MIRKIKLQRWAILGAGIWICSLAYGQNPSQSLEARVKFCESCHGPDGNKPITPVFPKIAGQYPDYLAKVLKDYRAGKRPNPIMRANAASLDDKTIQQLADYFASKKGDLVVKQY